MKALLLVGAAAAALAANTATANLASIAGAIRGTPFSIGTTNLTFQFHDAATGRLLHEATAAAVYANGRYSAIVPMGEAAGRAAMVTVARAGTIASVATAFQPPVMTMVRLQPTTPGTPQTGHFNVTGTGIADRFIANGTGFFGVGTGLIGLDASSLAYGTVADSRLSPNVALLGGRQTFSGTNTFSAPPAFTGASIPFTVSSNAVVINLDADLLDGQHGSYYLDAGNLTGTLVDARLSTNVMLRNNAQTVTGVKTFSTAPVFPAAPSFTSGGAPFTVSSTTVVTNLSADYLDGQHAAAFLTGIPNPLQLSGASPSDAILKGTNTSNADQTMGVWGYTSAASGSTYGVFGRTDSTAGRAVFGYATAASGTTYGVYGGAVSSAGYAGYFAGRGYFSGNVGIGVLAPASALEANGYVRADRFEDRGNTAYFVDPATAGPSVAAALNGWVGVGTTNPQDAVEVAGNVRATIFRDRDNTAYYVDAANASIAAAFNGSVGIGTTSPADKLDVNGSVRADSFKDRTLPAFFVDPGSASVSGSFNGNLGLGVASPAERLEVAGNVAATGRFNRATFRSNACTDSGGPQRAVDMAGSNMDQGELHFGNTGDDQWVDMWFIYSNSRLMGNYIRYNGSSVSTGHFRLGASGVIVYSNSTSGNSSGYAYWDGTGYDVYVYETTAGNGYCEWWSYDRNN